LFAFPKTTSYDYVQATHLDGAPNIPVGIWPEPLYTENDAAHSEFISSTVDQARAHSVTFGFSAGVEQAFSVGGSMSYSGKTDRQNTEQSRFTVTRKVKKGWAAHLDITSLALHAKYQAAIRQRTYDLLSDPTEDKSQTTPWDVDFVNTWGTHYANTITHGSITFAQTWFSMQAEQVMHDNKRKFSVEADTTVEDVKAGADLAVEDEWKKQTGLELSQEDTSHFGLGTPDPISIFLDLRPSSELMSPIFLPYDDKDPWGRFAPWVWTDVRRNFEKWATDHGLDQPINPDLVQNWRPRRFEITFPKIVVLGQAPGSSDEQPSGLLQGRGTISILPPDPTSKGTLDKSQSLVFGQYAATLGGQNVHPGPYSPDRNTLGCTIATTGGNVNAGAKGGLCFTLVFDLEVTESTDVALFGEDGRWEPVTKDRAHFTSAGILVELSFANLPNGKAQAPTTTISITSGIYTLQITVIATDAGPFEDS
jgi:hypothetical protein